MAKSDGHDMVIRGGRIYDGRGGAPFQGDVAVDGDTIAAIGEAGTLRGRNEIDAGGLAVAPGFINMLSWANVTLLEDGRSQSDLRQGVTLEVMGEGWSMGPLDGAMKAERDAQLECIAGPDTTEAVMAYMEKRDPEFTGR